MLYYLYMNEKNPNRPAATLTKDISFRLTELDFEYLRKQAEREHLRISQVLRRIINWHKDRQK